MSDTSQMEFPLRTIICSLHQSWETVIGYSYLYLFVCCFTSSLIYFVWFRAIIIPQYEKYKCFIVHFNRYQKHLNQQINPFMHKKQQTTNDKRVVLLSNIQSYSSLDAHKPMDVELNHIMQEYSSQFLKAKTKFYNIILLRNPCLSPNILDTIFSYNWTQYFLTTYEPYHSPWIIIAMVSMHRRKTNILYILLIIYPLCKLMTCIPICCIIFYQYSMWYAHFRLLHKEVSGWFIYLTILYCLLYLQPFVHSWNMWYSLQDEMRGNYQRDLKIWAIGEIDHDTELLSSNIFAKCYRIIRVVYWTISIIFYLFFVTAILHVLYTIIMSAAPFLILCWMCSVAVPEQVVSVVAGALCVYSTMSNFPTIFLNTFFGSGSVNWGDCSDYIWDFNNLDTFTVIVLVSWMLF
eukprot:203262_1